MRPSSALRIVGAALAAMTLPLPANASTAAEQKCAAFQAQVEACNAAVKNSETSGRHVPKSCVSILERAATHPCG